jgi:signal transduction histidine kinase
LLLVLAALLIPAGALVVGLGVTSARAYFQEVTQRQNAGLAKNLVAQSELMAGETLNSAELNDLAKMLAMTNPGVEIYVIGGGGDLLGAGDTDLGAVAIPIDLGPVERYLQQPERLPVLGTDPLRGGRTIFSAAPLPGGEGYLYIVLTNELQTSVIRSVQTSTALRIGLWGSVLGLVLLLFGGALAFTLLTRRLRRLNHAMRVFRSSDFDRQAIALPTTLRQRDEIDELTGSFLEVAEHVSDQYHALREADRNRRELVGNISHDLRTPLAALQGYLETLALRGDRLSRDERDAFLEAAQAHGARLSRLIEQLFELSTLESGQGRPHPEPFLLQELVQDVTHEFGLRSEEKGVALELIVDRELPFVAADIGMIERVVTNLLDNALRHTQSGGRVTLALERAGEEGVRVRVSDTGHGIASEDLPRVFERFFRASSAREGEGTGLGLAIVRRILELHGSRIEVDSRIGEGAHFWFDLPRASGA